MPVPGILPLIRVPLRVLVLMRAPFTPAETPTDLEPTFTRTPLAILKLLRKRKPMLTCNDDYRLAPTVTLAIADS